MKKAIATTVILILALCASPSHAFRNVKKVRRIEFRGLRYCSKYEIIGRVDMRVLPDAIVIDIDSLESALKEIPLIRSYRVAEQDGGIVVAVVEREPAFVFAVKKGNEIIPFETDDQFKVLSVRRVHTAERPVIVIGAEDVVNGALTERVRRFTEYLRRLEEGKHGVVRELSEISIAEREWTVVTLRNRPTRFYLKSAEGIGEAFRYCVSYLDGAKRYPDTVRIINNLALMK